MGEFAVTQAELSAGDVDSKLYENWDVGRSHLFGDNDRPLARTTNRGAGVYSAWYYIPRSYRMQSDGW